MNTQTQTCSKCNTPKALSEFHRRGIGHQQICKSCRCAHSREGYRERGKSRINRPILIVNTADFPALEKRIQALQPRLRSLAARFSHDVLEADDIYQEMTTAILIKCKPDDMDGFFVQCAKWTAQAYKAKRVTSSYYQEDLDISEEDTEFISATNAARITEDELIQREAFGRFESVINSLPEKNRKIIALLSMGKNQKQIAKQLQVSEQTISDRLKMIRAHIAAVTSDFSQSLAS